MLILELEFIHAFETRGARITSKDIVYFKVNLLYYNLEHTTHQPPLSQSNILNILSCSTCALKNLSISQTTLSISV